SVALPLAHSPRRVASLGACPLRPECPLRACLRRVPDRSWACRDLRGTAPGKPPRASGKAQKPLCPRPALVFFGSDQHSWVNRPNASISNLICFVWRRDVQTREQSEQRSSCLMSSALCTLLPPPSFSRMGYWDTVLPSIGENLDSIGKSIPIGRMLCAEGR